MAKNQRRTREELEEEDKGDEHGLTAAILEQGFQKIVSVTTLINKVKKGMVTSSKMQFEANWNLSVGLLFFVVQPQFL